MKKMILTLIFIVMPLILMADMTIVSKVETGSLMGQPGHKGTTTTYVKGNKAKIEMQAGKYSIVDLNSGKVYVVDDSRKEIMMMTKDQLNQMGGMMKQMGAMKMQADIKKLDSSHTVNGFKCDDYQVNMTGMFGLKSVQCLSTDVDTKEFEPFKPFTDQWGKMFEGFDPSKLPGIPIRSQGKIIVMGQEAINNSEIVSISRDSVPESVFSVPSGYRSVEMPSMPQIPQQ